MDPTLVFVLECGLFGAILCLICFRIAGAAGVPRYVAILIMAAFAANANTDWTVRLGRAGLLSGPLTLRYFDARGRAEAIRLALHDHKVPFADETFSPEEWRAGGLKAKLIAEGKLAYGQVPLLSVGPSGLSLFWYGGTQFVQGKATRSMLLDRQKNEVHIVQSHAILRYLGRLHGFYSDAPSVLARVDVASDGTEDARKGLMAIKYGGGTDEEKDAKYQAYFEAVAPKWFGFYETMLGSHANTAGSSPYVAGTVDASMADYLLFDLIDNHAGQQPARTKALLESGRFPLLVAWRKQMEARPNIATYLASDARRKA